MGAPKKEKKHGKTRDRLKEREVVGDEKTVVPVVGAAEVIQRFRKLEKKPGQKKQGGQGVSGAVNRGRGDLGGLPSLSVTCEQRRRKTGGGGIAWGTHCKKKWDFETWAKIGSPVGCQNVVDR